MPGPVPEAPATAAPIPGGAGHTPGGAGHTPGGAGHAHGGAPSSPGGIRPRLERLWRRLCRLGVVRAARSSLSVRIAVAMTGAVVVLLALFGVIISTELRDSMFASRRDAVLEDAAVRFSGAQSVLDQSTASTPDQVQDATRQLVESVRGSAAGAGAVSVMLLRAPGADETFRINEIVSTAMGPLVSDQLRADVEAGTGAYWQSVAIPVGDQGASAPGIVTGRLVRVPRAGLHEMYIVYSLQSDQATIDTVLRVLGIGVVPIIVALPVGTFWVLFHLLRPVRRTAEAATLLADGDLDSRVEVEGSDEMARLGTAFNHMASSLQSQITEYDELSRFQQRFVSDVSHELRTPLTTIRMAEEMIWEDRDDFGPATKRSAELLHTQVDRFEAMLADLLEISRYDAQSALLDPEPTDLRQVVPKVVEANEDLATRLGVDIRVHLSERRCSADVDVRRVERVLRNLLVNAVEHAEGRPVDIDVDATADVVAVRVRDHGVGMSPQTVAHVFDRFFRADPARTRTTGGTGLGLSIATEDVALHHGRLEAWGELGVGSSFLMVLPRRQVGGDAGALVSPLALWEEET